MIISYGTAQLSINNIMMTRHSNDQGIILPNIFVGAIDPVQNAAFFQYWWVLRILQATEIHYAKGP